VKSRGHAGFDAPAFPAGNGRSGRTRQSVSKMKRQAVRQAISIDPRIAEDMRGDRFKLKGDFQFPFLLGKSRTWYLKDYP
jgi:hypothetical protein